MQFGVFSVGDVTPDPTTGRAPTEAERIQAMVTIALKVEEVGLDVFASGEHHNPPFVPSSPTTMLGYIAARTERLILSTATTLITTNDPVKIAEDYAMLQHLAKGRVDLMLVPIGDNYTMGVEDAVRAVGFVKLKTVIPMHYNTWDVIKADPQEFRRQVGGRADVVVLQPGQSLKHS